MDNFSWQIFRRSWQERIIPCSRLALSLSKTQAYLKEPLPDGIVFVFIYFYFWLFRFRPREGGFLEARIGQFARRQRCRCWPTWIWSCFGWYFRVFQSSSFSIFFDSKILYKGDICSFQTQIILCACCMVVRQIFVLISYRLIKNIVQILVLSFFRLFLRTILTQCLARYRIGDLQILARQKSQTRLCNREISPPRNSILPKFLPPAG